MRALVLAVGLVGIALTAAPAVAEPLQPAEAKAHVGQTVTVEGTVGDIDSSSRPGVTFIDIGGRYPNNPFTAVISANDASKFPDIGALNGKTVDVTGQVHLYKGRPEIILNDAAQLKAK